MNTPGVPATGNGALELPPFSLDVQALDLGNEVKAVGLELVETENREPVRGKEGAEIWSDRMAGSCGTLRCNSFAQRSRVATTVRALRGRNLWHPRGKRHRNRG